MKDGIIADPTGRRERIAEQVRLERAALAELDRAAARLDAANEERVKLIAQSAAVVADVRSAHDKALMAYTQSAGLERAARLLGHDEGELRRLLRGMSR
jgi:hypothetical protein